MEFKTNKPIFRQIIDLCYTRIMNGEWTDGTRIPSVREISVELAVNVRTVLNAMDELQRMEIIYPKRGMGFFLAADAKEKVKTALKTEFFDVTLTELFNRMRQLDISIEEVAEAFLKVEKIEI